MPHKKKPPRVVAVYKQESNNPSHLAVNVHVFVLLLNAKDPDRHSSCFTFFLLTCMFAPAPSVDVFALRWRWCVWGAAQRSAA
jgi:hypothetical protein